MDQIFFKTSSILNLVRVARKEPRRFGKRGELLVEYAEHEVGITTILDDNDNDGDGEEEEGGVLEVDDDGDVEEGGRGRRRDGRGRGRKEE